MNTEVDAKLHLSQNDIFKDSHNVWTLKEPKNILSGVKIMLGGINSFSSKKNISPCPHGAYNFVRISNCFYHKNKYIITNCDMFKEEKYEVLCD